jgi:hypothetical protein
MTEDAPARIGASKPGSSISLKVRSSMSTSVV